MERRLAQDRLAIEAHIDQSGLSKFERGRGTRYQNHEAMGSQVLLFARLNTLERAFLFLGTATYVSHVGEAPMTVTWRLHNSLPGDVFQAFAAAVA